MQYVFELVTVEWGEADKLIEILNAKGKEGYCVVNVFDTSRNEGAGIETLPDGTPLLKLGTDFHYYNYVLQKQLVNS